MQGSHGAALLAELIEETTRGPRVAGQKFDADLLSVRDHLWGHFHTLLGSGANYQYLGARAQGLLEIVELEEMTFLSPPVGHHSVWEHQDIGVIGVGCDHQPAEGITLDHGGPCVLDSLIGKRYGESYRAGVLTSPPVSFCTNA